MDLEKPEVYSDGGLHWAFLDESILFSSLVLSSFSKFLFASLLTISICLSERLLSHVYDKHWCPHSLKRSRWKRALWRSLLYWMATLLRLAYMLIAMSFHIGLILVAATTLAAAQFFRELHSPSQSENDRDPYISQPLLRASEDPYPLASLPTTRPRSKSKPDEIFIHPTQSNLARADAVALELGLAGETERVRGNYHISKYSEEHSAWESGKGRDVARALLSREPERPSIARQSAAQTHSFRIGDDDDEGDSDSSSS